MNEIIIKEPIILLIKFTPLTTINKLSKFNSKFGICEQTHK